MTRATKIIYKYFLYIFVISDLHVNNKRIGYNGRKISKYSKSSKKKLWMINQQADDER